MQKGDFKPLQFKKLWAILQLFKVLLKTTDILLECSYLINGPCYFKEKQLSHTRIAYYGIYVLFYILLTCFYQF